MTREDEIEIRMRYREAKDKRAQVDILCQMFETEEEEICRSEGRVRRWVQEEKR